MGSIKMTKTELDNLINEEAQKVKKEFLLKKQLNEIEKELKVLKEVHAGADMNPGADGVHAGQKTPVFTKKGSHLVEDDVEDMATADVEPEGNEEMVADEDVAIEKGKLLDAIKELGKQLNLTGVIDFDAVEEVPGEEDSIEIDTDDISGDEENGENIAPENSDVEVVTGADDAVGGEESEESEEEAAEEAGLDECGDAAVAENIPAEKETIMESPENTRKKERLAEEVNRWKFLAGM